METTSSLAPRGCAVCSSSSGLLRCGGCLVVHYCSREHQMDHRQDHKASCTTIAKTRQALQDEEAKLRARPDDMFMPTDVFSTSAGYFWSTVETRDYMRSRFAAADALLKINNVDAVKTALDHFTDMLRLCRTDNLGVRDIIPFLMLRLGQEQECYTFLKWWATDGADLNYDVGNTGSPHLSIRGADPFEDINVFDGQELGTAHAVAVTLLKARLLLDLSACEAEHQADGPPLLPKLARPVGSLVQAKVQSMGTYDISSSLKSLTGQYRSAYNMVHDKNPHVWECLRQREQGAGATSSASSSFGFAEEAELVLYHSKRAWDESVDAGAMIEAQALNLAAVSSHGLLEYNNAVSGEYHTTGRAAQRPQVIMLCLEKQRHQEELFDEIHGALIPRLNSKASVQRETSAKGALARLDQSPPPSIILVADAAIARMPKVWDRVIDRLRAGATVILGGLFSAMARPAELNRMFATTGLPWKTGADLRATTKLCSKVLDSTGTAGQPELPRAYSLKAVFLQNVSESARVYVADNNATDTAVAFAKVGKGRLGYIGDVSGEEGSESVVMAMCGL
ncbi:hypothetical protein MAPG_01824 [Magnaporthiopsis poae ATCC 64411]|uniref:MYND-type domain-containing protein n=1 Tax=Magnaporthiopsis poae (strain ATCC 64411 / 73-15) TaxID=644358 RepID=A0A0C4DPQ3_MAGP6|nr:hypothetical protein MAPG_01824 [Magnaporthiopsis poae ATCC 64411]